MSEEATQEEVQEEVQKQNKDPFVSYQGQVMRQSEVAKLRESNRPKRRGRPPKVKEDEDA